MNDFRKIVASTDRVFGTDLKRAEWMMRKKELTEGLIKVRNKAKYLLLDKKFFVSDELDKVSQRLFFGNQDTFHGLRFVGTPVYWTVLGTFNLLLRCFSKNPKTVNTGLCMFAVDVSLGAIIFYINSRIELKRMKRNGGAV